MKSTLSTIGISAVFVILAVMMILTSPAQAQSDSAMRRENNALRARVGTLEAELKASQDRVREMQQSIKRLESQIEKLRRSSTGSHPTEPLAAEKVTIDESKPNASPRALLKAVIEQYQEQLGGMETGSFGDRDRSIYMRAVQKWASTVNREYRGPITWTVRVTDLASRTQRGVVLTMQAVDPVTDTVLGDSFEALVSNRSLLKRLEALDSNGALLNEKLDLKGVLLPNIRSNANRESEGTFNNPPFIGPFAEFAFGVEVQSLRKTDDNQNVKKPTTRNAS